MNPNNENITELEICKSKYEKAYDYITKGAIIRSQVKWYEEGEKNTKFFLSLENNKKKKSTIRKIYNKENKLISNPKEIMTELKSFYSDLYREMIGMPTAEQTFLRNDDIPKLSEIDKDICEGELTMNECLQALKSFDCNKSPGNDGLTAEFYICFWSLLGKQLVDCLNFCYEHGRLSNSQRQAVIRLIEKREKDKRFITNWRPISLLNVDSKIGSKALAKRIEKVLPSVIHFNQCAYVKDRSTFDALRTIEDIMNLTKTRNISGLLVAVDFQKAFDSVNWKFLTNTLQSFGFGPVFIKWVKTFYSGITSCVMNNGFSSGYFEVKKGVRQGDPLSAFLFILVIEVLAINIRNNKNIKGIKVGNIEIKLSIFADDLTAFLKNKTSYDNLMNTLEQFEKCSGLKVNKDKTEAHWLGRYYDNPPALLSDVKRVNKAIKILGIFFTYDDALAYSLNFDRLIQSIDNTLNLWKWRNLTIFGKVQIIKTFIVPKISYMTNIISLDAIKLKELNKKFFTFIWNGKDKIKRSVLISNYDKGGLKMVHLESYIRAQKVICLKKYWQNYSSTWKQILDFHLRRYGGKFLLQCNPEITLLCNDIPDFYTNCLKTWSSLKLPSLNEDDIICDELIWNNKQILIEKKTVYNRSLKEKGLMKINDLLSSNGGLVKTDELISRGFSYAEAFSVMSLIDAIPSEWRKKLKNRKPIALSNIVCRKKQLLLNGNPTNFINITQKSVYLELTSRIINFPTAQKSFSYIYPNTKFDWKAIYELPLKVTIDTKTRQFQYKILHRILYTNKMLFKMNLVDTSKCTFCNEFDETIEHLMLNCSYSMLFWNDVIQWLNTFQINIDLLSETTILFGIFDNGDFKLINHLILIGKQVIYTCRARKIKPNLPIFLAKLQNISAIEFNVAKRRGALEHYHYKWNNLLSWLQ